MPAKIAASMAGSPSVRAGDLDEKVGLAAALMQTARSCQRAGRCRGPAEARPPATPSRPRRRSARGSAGTARRRWADPLTPARRTAPRAILPQAPSGRCRRRSRAVLDGVIEDRRVRGEPGHRELVDIALQRAAIQQLTGDVVEPEALAEVVELSWSLSWRRLQVGWQGIAAPVAARAGRSRASRRCARSSRPPAARPLSACASWA